MPTKILKRVPRLSRVTVARKLASVVEQVVSWNDLPSWARLLSFSKKCLHTPVRGGKQWSLATLVNKLVAQESPTIEMPVALPHNQAKPSKRHNGTDHLAFRVSSRLDEGDYRRAVRLACNEDVIADQSIGTLEALKLKHPSSPPDSDIPTLEAASSLAFTIDTHHEDNLVPQRLGRGC